MITAQSAALADEVTAVNILGRRMANSVLLIQALGGGWDRLTLPEQPECCGKLASSNAKWPLLSADGMEQSNTGENKKTGVKKSYDNIRQDIDKRLGNCERLLSEFTG